MNVLDVKAALLAKHAQHVVLIHFPIALFLAGVIFDFGAHFTAFWTKRTILATAAYANLLAAAGSVPPVVVTGILAWQWQLDSQKLRGVLLFHLVLGCISGVLIGVIGWIHFRTRRAPDLVLSEYRLPLEFIAALVVIFTGHLGGFLSGVNVPS